jgi:hypothetical protein
LIERTDYDPVIRGKAQSRDTSNFFAGSRRRGGGLGIRNSATKSKTQGRRNE